MFALALSAIVAGCGAADLAAYSPTDQSRRLEEVDEIWQLIDRTYIDPTFNQQDWSAVRQDYMNRTYPSDQALHDALREMMGLLEDPGSQYFTPEEFSALQPPDGDLAEVEVTVAAAPVVQYRVEMIDGTSVGYIQVSYLESDTPSETASAIATLDAQNVAIYVLDLRSNPGGLLNSAVEVADLWLEDGLIATLNSRSTVREAQADRASLMTDKPLALLVNGETGNGSELVAATLQDQQRAVVVGAPTYGSNLIRSIRPLPAHGSGMMLTTARWYPPSGQDVSDVGVQPDIVVEEGATQQIGTAADPLLRAAVVALSSTQGE
ncbi:MAG: hypothetical protein HC929_01170 [Leptolyngbyaceae cyanobacterium SM2_5_2]|nr:hypothetical protein [Leptolyngbyaceae cyanobacterium SM2_5_2]